MHKSREMSGLTQIAVFVLTNTRWAQIPDEKQREIQIADGRNPNCKWEKYGEKCRKSGGGECECKLREDFLATTGHLASSLLLLMKIEQVGTLIFKDFIQSQQLFKCQLGNSW